MKWELCAEIGSNHDGKLTQALQLIDDAAIARATSVKFQYFRGKSLTKSANDRKNLKKYELPAEWLPILQKKAHAHDLRIGYSVFSPNSCKIVAKYADFLKISAYDLEYQQLLTAAIHTRAPIVLSTAMATINKIQASLQLFHSLTQCIAVLHGTAAYPAPPESLNLLCIPEMSKSLYGLRVGYSDHTQTIEAAKIAYILGATWIEKHFRGSIVTESPDWIVSARTEDFWNLDEALKRTDLALGSSEKRLQRVEIPLYKMARRTSEKTLRG